MPQTHQLLNVAEVAEILNLSPRTVRLHAKSGKIPAQKMGAGTAAYVFDRAAIEALVA